ncbi:MAG: hypothetical protein BGO39_15235 [Chloroflexi bacterium 54-19]|nr:MAG: hypothetical protein BGO39_15235 [Chloroflexi bacterium 54-19]
MTRKGTHLTLSTRRSDSRGRAARSFTGQGFTARTGLSVAIRKGFAAGFFSKVEPVGGATASIHKTGTKSQEAARFAGIFRFYTVFFSFPFEK